MKFTKISLYIHIPFCINKCSYCDFFSVKPDSNIEEKVIKKIASEMDTRLSELDNPIIETIFIGGGTPSVLSFSKLEALLKSIKRRVQDPVEWTVEANPESVSRDFLNILKKYGVNRLSVGIQSFNQSHLEALGRNARVEDVERALKLIKELWSGEVSLDLICGIPGQNMDSVKKDIERAVSYNPGHISFYSLIIEEGTPLEDKISKGFISELTQEESDSIWLYGRELLKRYGYKQYEVSNFYKTSPSYHNLSYWELKPYLGIGPGAVSTLIKEFKVVRIHNPKSIGEYLNNEFLEEDIPPGEFLKDYVMMGLRLKTGINQKRFKSIFNKSFLELIPDANLLINKALLEVNSREVYLTDKGYDIMNSVLIELMDYIDRAVVEELNWFY